MVAFLFCVINVQILLKSLFINILQDRTRVFNGKIKMVASLFCVINVQILLKSLFINILHDNVLIFTVGIESSSSTLRLPSTRFQFKFKKKYIIIIKIKQQTIDKSLLVTFIYSLLDFVALRFCLQSMKNIALQQTSSIYRSTSALSLNSHLNEEL